MDQCLGIKLKNGCLVDGVKPVLHTQHGSNQIMGHNAECHMGW